MNIIPNSINVYEHPIKCANIVIHSGSAKRSLDIVWEYHFPMKYRTLNEGRIYFIIVKSKDILELDLNDDLQYIKKIGASGDKGGIKATLGFYIGGNTGSPSIRSFGINLLMYNELVSGNIIEIWVQFIENGKANLSVFDEVIDGEFPLDPRPFEKIFVDKFYEKEGKYPDWNFQEQCKKWENVMIHEISINELFEKYKQNK